MIILDDDSVLDRNLKIRTGKTLNDVNMNTLSFKKLILISIIIVQTFLYKGCFFPIPEHYLSFPFMDLKAGKTLLGFYFNHALKKN